jgi:excisionase family DNA binding protein
VTTTKDSPTLTVTGAAQLLGVAFHTVIRWADAGILPCVRNSSNARLFTRMDVERCARERAVKASKK